MERLFLDASFAIALASKADQHHDEARRLGIRLKRERIPLVTTRAVVLEIGNALAKPRHRQAAVQLLSTLEADPAVEIVPLTEVLYQRGFMLYSQRPDKGWSLVDCVSFEVMAERGIREALTTDEHFDQAGFRALLRQSA
jgi:predicted nucleic acid-binding protein